MKSGSVLLVIGLAIGVSRTPLAQAQAPEGLPRFEVASVKQNTSGDSRTAMRTQPGGRLVVTNVRMKNLIAVAFGMADPQALIDARVLGGPEWVGSDRFDVV